MVFGTPIDVDGEHIGVRQQLVERDGLWRSAAVLDEMFEGYPAEARAAITRDTVARLYGL